VSVKWDPYREVGARTREAIEVLMAHHPTRTTLAAFVGVVHYLTSRSRFDDHVTHDQLAQVTGLDQRSLRRALRDLANIGALEYRPGFSKPDGGRVASWIQLPVPRVTQTRVPGTTQTGVPRVDSRRDPGWIAVADPGSHSPLSERSTPSTSPRVGAQRLRLAAVAGALDVERWAPDVVDALITKCHTPVGDDKLDAAIDYFTAVAPDRLRVLSEFVYDFDDTEALRMSPIDLLWLFVEPENHLPPDTEVQAIRAAARADVAVRGLPAWSREAG
jgi:hypothetical protein